jgi:mRNA-degrading endonuclease RelE of RelBE toxin-antitoxin system
VSEPPVSPRLTINWSLDARANLRAIDREIALDILHCIDRYIATRNGDVKKLKPLMTGFRLRCGDYRIFFKQMSANGISITGILHRSQAYR